MFCVKCGTQLPDGSKFCSNCGANLSPTNTTVVNAGKCLFSIERKKAFGGMAAKTKVYIDGNLVKELSSGETFSLELNNGKHNLYCDAVMMDRTPSYEFVGDNNKISYYVSYPSLAQGMMNVGGRSLIVNKIDLFNNHLNLPIIIYNTTNQSHSQRMTITVMTPIRI
jgi:hypothetical protein